MARVRIEGSFDTLFRQAQQLLRTSGVGLDQANPAAQSGLVHELPAISSIAQTIQLAIAPVFLLAGIGALLNVLTGRLARVVDRARVLEALHANSTGDEHQRTVIELRIVDRRMRLVNAAIALIVSSAIVVCVLVALLFITQLAGLPFRVAVAIAFVLGMAFLIAGLVLFLIEINVALRYLHVREELLEREERNWRRKFRPK